MTKRFSETVRSGLFASTAIFALAQAAHAETADRYPTAAVETPHENSVLTDALNDAAEDAQWRVAAKPALADVFETPEITINNNFTPTDARDPVNINGIGQIIVDAGGGSVGLCTASLINPRVVLFAAHCVNTRAATAYGAGSGGVGIGIGFETNTRANAAGQTDELVRWLLGGAGGAGRFETNRAQAFYNIDQVFWNSASTAAASCTAPGSCFLEADIATAVLDAPTRNIPTWALLFSPLATPSAINPATGTGYHVSIGGYGRFGTGTTGQNGGNDFRRRAAENMLGALTSIDARNLFLFGTAGAPSRPQLLYWLDFDDPARGTAAANPRDFNGFRDNALTREGSTGPGDSGGPLILDQTFSKSVILGVLSGGSTFFAGQPGGSYGTQSFYQPLFLYWDWIVANNPYRYVTANAGNRNWEDASGWVTTLDPAYNILSGGALVNGIPTELGGTNVATAPQFGELCFQSPLNSATPPSTNECQNLATGAARNNVPNTPNGTGESAPVLTAIVTDAAAPDSLAVADVAAAVAGGSASAGMMRDGMIGAVETPMAAPGFRDGPLPAATLANGLPGATNFVPNNVNSVRATGTAGRYFDVTLRNAGTITLNSAVTIDRFTIAGAQSQLTVANGASLNSLIDITQATGIVQNNGVITTGGDYLFTSGLLSGTGRVNAPFLTSVMGNFAPGTLGTIGTLTIGGNVVMSSGSTFAVDLGAGGTSDLLSVVANGGSSGLANVGGRVIFSPAGGATIRANDVFTILTAAGGVSGTFSTSALSAILTPQFVYSANNVQVRLAAGSYGSVVANTPVQRSYGALLDRNRGGTNVGPLYDFLDLQNAATIQATLESWAPRTETLKSAVGTTAVDNMTRFFRSRVASMDLTNGFGGSVATLGNPLQAVARLSADRTQGGQREMGYADTEQMASGLPDTVSVFFAGGYLDGSSSPMATAIPAGGDDSFDGYYIATGVESELGENAGIGFALSYTDIDGATSGAAQNASGKLFQGTLYGKLQNEGGLTLDAQVSAANFRAETDRAAVLGPVTYRLQSRDDTLALSSEVGLSKAFAAGSLTFGPRVAMRASRIEFTPTIETAGAAALAFDRGRFDSLQGMAGLTLSGGMKVRPYASAYYVHEFEDKPASFGANFVGGVGLPAVFALSGTDKNWFEASAGIAFGSETFEVALGADTTIGRSDVSNQSYRGTVTFRF
nr:autotransporter domain-containing protein [uncultured Sphingorhabdus sp.]